MEDILLIDDNQAYCEQVQKTLSLHGIRLHFFTDVDAGLHAAIKHHWGTILLDVVLNQHLDGLDILKKITAEKPHIPIIMISGSSTIKTAIAATKIGAYDFLEKPLDADRLLITIQRALEKNKLTSLNQNLFEELSKHFTLVGKSEAIQKIVSDIERIAATDVKVFILGESGVGKDMAAKLIHFRSERESKPFVAINCAAIPPQLIEAELFGYVKGAFTGAVETKTGLIDKAEGGTLFLDEIAEMPIFAQAKLLKFLNDGQYTPLGSNEFKQSNVRIISATNRDIASAMRLGSFREDLFYRLNVFNLFIPPLRYRPDDIPPLAEFFLRRACEKFSKNITNLSDDSLELMLNQKWQGNVRQLKSAVYRMVLFANSNIIDFGTAATAIQMDRSNEMVVSVVSYDEALAEFEKLYFLSKLNILDWNIERVAHAVNLSPVILQAKLVKLGITGYNDIGQVMQG